VFRSIPHSNLSQELGKTSHTLELTLYMISEDLQDTEESCNFKMKNVLLPWHTFLPASLVWL
jgi:hypothetical protein